MYNIFKKFASEHHRELLLPVLNFIHHEDLISAIMDSLKRTMLGRQCLFGGKKKAKKSSKIEHAQRAQFCL